MNAGIIAEQMLVLALMMAAGYMAFRLKLVSEEGGRALSSLIINIFNPCLVVSSVLNKEVLYGPNLVMENMILVILFFLILIILSKVFTKLMRLEKGEVNTYRLMMIFPNLGFMGIPLVRSLYGEEAVIFVAFYIMGYNLLVYSYGIILATLGEGDTKISIPWKKLCNTGLMACLTAVVVFAFHIHVPSILADFVNAMGDATVPLSMLMVGITVAQSDLKSIFTDRKQILFVIINMIMIPLLCIVPLRLLPIDPMSYGIFILLLAMPVGSVVTMVEKEYGSTGGRISAGAIAFTSVVSVITIPIITFFA